MSQITVRNIGESSGDILPLSVQSGEFYLDANVNMYEIRNAINSSTFAPRYRIFILNEDESIKEEIPMKDIMSGGSFSENYQNGQRRSLSFTLINDDKKYMPNVDKIWVNTKFLLENGLELADGRTVWVKNGIFVIDTLDPEETAEQKTMAIQTSDKFKILEGAKGTLEAAVEIDVGSEIIDVIQTLLMDGGGDAYPLDPKPPIFHSSFRGKTVQSKISKEIGAKKSEIIQELATQLSAEYFYNANGNLTFVPINSVSLDIEKPIIYDYYAEDGDFSNLGFNLDISSIINRVVVIGGNINNVPYQAIAVNDDASSPLSCKRIGYRTSNISDSNITSRLLAEERAEYELRALTILKTTSSTNVSFNPLLSVNNVIAITDEHFDLYSAKFLLQGISYNLDYSGQMSITISNIDNLAFITNKENKKKGINLENRKPQSDFVYYTKETQREIPVELINYQQFNVIKEENNYQPFGLSGADIENK